MRLSYSDYTPLFNMSTAGLKSQPWLKYLHLITPVLVRRLLSLVCYSFQKFSMSKEMPNGFRVWMV